ncbi:hypothetical protein RUND412_005147 [Rhizina undulata]
MITPSSRPRCTRLKLTLNHHDRPLPELETPTSRNRGVQYQAPESNTKMKVDMEEFHHENGNKTFQQLRPESPKLPAPAPAAPTCEEHRYPPLAIPLTDPQVPPIASQESLMAELDAVNTEVHASSDTIDSSVPAMLSENSKGPGEYMALPGSEERQQRSPDQEQYEISGVSELFSTAKPPSDYMDDLLKFVSHENSILLDLQAHIYRLQKEVSLLCRVSVQPGAANPDQKILDAKAAEPERKEKIIDNMNKECLDALDEMAVFRENELEAALRAKARDLQELDQQLELRDAEISESKECWSNLNKTLQQKSELLDARESEVAQREKDFREKEINFKSHKFEFGKGEKALQAREAFLESRMAENSPPARGQIVEIPDSEPLHEPGTFSKKRKLNHEEAEVTAYCEETGSKPRCIIFHLTRDKNTTERYYNYIQDLEINIEQLVICPRKSPFINIYFVTPDAAVTFMTQRANNGDSVKSYDGYAPVRIKIEDGFITASLVNQFHPVPQDIGLWIVKHGASRILIVEKLSPDTTKAQLRNDFFLDQSLLKIDIEKWDGIIVGRLHYRSISEAVIVKVKWEHGQNTSGKSVTTYMRCSLRFGRGPGGLY